MAIYFGNKEVGTSFLPADVSVELSTQKIALDQLEAAINNLKDKPKDMLQERVDTTNSCANLFYSYGGSNVDFISALNTSNATDMSFMFYSCGNLTSLDLSTFDTTKVTSMRNMFGYCKKLNSIDLSSFDTRSMTDTLSMFNYCEKLTNIVGVINMINVTNTNGMFNFCLALTDVTLLNIKKNLSFPNTSKLSNETLINTIQQLWDLTDSTSQTLTLLQTCKEKIANIYVKLVDVTNEMLAQDEYAVNKKPCVVCESTDEGAMTLIEYANSKNWTIA